MITESRVLEVIPVVGSQPAGDVSHKPSGRLPILSTKPAVTLTTLKRAATNFAAWWRGTTGVNSLPKTVTRQRRRCDLNPGPSAPESSTLTTQPLSHPVLDKKRYLLVCCSSVVGLLGSDSVLVNVFRARHTGRAQSIHTTVAT